VVLEPQGRLELVAAPAKEHLRRVPTEERCSHFDHHNMNLHGLRLHVHDLSPMEQRLLKDLLEEQCHANRSHRDRYHDVAKELLHRWDHAAMASRRRYLEGLDRIHPMGQLQCDEERQEHHQKVLA
jgi:hypothetical protein